MEYEKKFFKWNMKRIHQNLLDSTYMNGSYFSILFHSTVLSITEKNNKAKYSLLSLQEFALFAVKIRDKNILWNRSSS